MHCPIASTLLIYRNKMIIFLHRSTHFPSPKLKKTKTSGKKPNHLGIIYTGIYSPWE